MSASGPERDRLGHRQEERLARLRRLLGEILDTAARTGCAADLARVLEELEAALERIEALDRGEATEARGEPEAPAAPEGTERPDRGNPPEGTEASDPFLEALRCLLDDAPGGGAEEPR